uniref:Uncharacterized protein n=1 Tax=Knipowitschia caucasica TaxID=637954 RepID=A0AAV2KTM8_KNICA
MDLKSDHPHKPSAHNSKEKVMSILINLEGPLPIRASGKSELLSSGLLMRPRAPGPVCDEKGGKEPGRGQSQQAQGPHTLHCVTPALMEVPRSEHSVLPVLTSHAAAKQTGLQQQQ